MESILQKKKLHEDHATSTLDDKKMVYRITLIEIQSNVIIFLFIVPSNELRGC